MSIAEEILRIQTAKADIKTAIENKGVTVGDGTIDTYAEKINEISGGDGGSYEQGFEDGKNSVVNFGEYSTVIKFNNLNLFGRKEVTLNLNNVTAFSEVIRAIPINQGGVPNTTLEHLTLNCPNQITSMYYLIGGDASRRESTLKHLTLNVDTQNAGLWNYCFRWAEALEIIDGTPLDFSYATNVSNDFYGCLALKEVRFAPNSLKLSTSLSNSNLLSTDSIQSIIDGLATVETAQTLTLHNNLKILQSQVDSANAKGWTVAGGTVVSEEEYNNG